MVGSLLWILVLVGAVPSEECRTAPPRGSEAFWTFVDACGCDALEPPARASDDYDRFMSACSRWRQRNLPGVPAGPDSTASPKECRNPPSRASDSFWTYIDACGCTGVDPPSRASSDYERFMKACVQWRERNPRIEVATPSPSPSPTPTALPSPTPRPSPSVKPPGGG